MSPDAVPPARTRLVEVTRTYLRLARPGDLRPAKVQDPRLAFVPLDDPSVARSRFFYKAVGEAWHRHDRNAWSDEQYAAYLARPGVSLWVLRFGTEDAGYVEYERHADGAIEIALFGLMPRFVGRGFGKHLLTVAAEQAWAQKPHAVWLHTCTLDSPRALPNYKARGFVPFREERYMTTISG
ncbi:MAG: GNAT family N-acetyltransferase [Gemmatimonadetes bacterium]|nr:GNAT family N-acetyltransferase [Gemmatimonadota bacterium]